MTDTSAIWPNPWTTPLIPVADAGALLGLSRSAAYRAVDRGNLPARYVSGALLVPVAELMAGLGLPVPPAPTGRPRVL